MAPELRTRIATGTLLLVVACSSAPEWTRKTDPFANQKFPDLTAEQLRNNVLPEGFRLGDPGLAPEEDGKRPPRWSRDPNPGTFGVAARGRGPHIDHVQWIYPDNRKVTVEFLRSAGIEPGAPVALGRARSRNWGRLTQSHASGERTPVTLFATNRPEVFVQLRDHDQTIDCIVWCKDRSVLLDHDERTAIAEPRQALEAALASADWPNVQAWLDRLAYLPTKGPDDVKVRAQTAIDAHRLAVNTPLLAELDALAASHETAWTKATADAKVKLYATNLAKAYELRTKLQRVTSPVPERIRQWWDDLAKAEAGRRKPETARSAKDWFWLWAPQVASAVPTPIATAWQQVGTLVSRDTPYLDGLAARRQLAATRPPLLPYTGPADRVARGHLAAQVKIWLAATRKAGSNLTGDWIEKVLLYDLETLANPPERPFPYLDKPFLDEVITALGELEQPRRADNKDTVVRRLRALHQQEMALLGGQQKNARPGVFAHAHFLSTQLSTIAGELRTAAEAAAARGMPATAAQLLLQSAMVGRNTNAKVADLPALANDEAQKDSYAIATKWLLPMLAEVLPSIDANTAQAHRLCELLTEGKAASWPLVRFLAVGIQPGEVVALRSALGLPASFAHLVRKDEDKGLALIDKPTSSDPRTDERFWQKYSGWSAETITEGAWIRQENAWIAEEQPIVDQERIEVEKITASLNAEGKRIDDALQAHNAGRDRLDRTSSTQVDAFNRRIGELRSQNQALQSRMNSHRPRVDAWQTRVKEMNKRIAEYNRRLAALNERRMREGAAGQNELDGMLLPTLTASIEQRLQAWIDTQVAKLPAGLDRSRETNAVKWWFGHPVAGPDLWTPPEGPGYAQLMAAACHRQGRRQSTNDAYAAKVAEFCYWAALGKVETREDTFRSHALEFTRFRDANVLKQALEKDMRLNAADRTRWLAILGEVRTEVFGKK